MRTKMTAVLLALVLLVGGICPGVSGSFAAAEDSAQGVTDQTVYDAADSAGQVVNTDRPDGVSDQDRANYSFTPLDAVLIMDISGSMERSDGGTGQTLLDYAKISATSFVNTLLSINPDSRIGVVFFSEAAYPALDLTGADGWDRITAAIQGLQAMGSTNTGGGYDVARTMLNQQGEPERRKMVIMLTDGQANAGGNDPISYGISKGRDCAAIGYVYNIGLVGGLSRSELNATRRVLNAGYETRYFEVDFDSISDAGTMITMLSSSIAMAASSAETLNDAGNVVMEDTFLISVGPGYYVRVTSESGDYLSTFLADQRLRASFGAVSQVNGQTYISVPRGHYVIDIRGYASASSFYRIRKITGLDMRETELFASYGWSDESIYIRITLIGDIVSLEDLSYNPIDYHQHDFDGNPATGLQRAIMTAVKSNTQILRAPAAKADKIEKALAKDRVYVLALAPSLDYYFVAYTAASGKIGRGWIPVKAMETPDGFVPVFPAQDEICTIGTAAEAYATPSFYSDLVTSLDAGLEVSVKHLERDSGQKQWAYVSYGTAKAVKYAYIPAEYLAGWTEATSPDFRLGKNLQDVAEKISFPAIPMARGLKLKVYSATDKSSFRGAKGKAIVSTNGEVRAAGIVENSWMLVEYDTNIGNTRVGYVALADIKAGIPELPLVIFSRGAAQITMPCTLSDDPNGFSEQIVSLDGSSTVTWLAAYGNPLTGVRLVYVESKAGKKRTRGFIPESCITR